MAIGQPVQANAVISRRWDKLGGISENDEEQRAAVFDEIEIDIAAL